VRSADELVFRVRQELTNLRLWLWTSSSNINPGIPRPCFPDPAAVVERLRGTPFSAEVERLADLVLQHRFPLPGGILETGPDIEWRRDYRTNAISGTTYFRLIPYLDVRRAGDHKVIWDLNRQQHLVLLAQAFLFTGRKEFLDEIERQIESWLEDNPYMRGINWTSSLEVGFRALSWLWVLRLVGAHLNQHMSRKLAVALCQHGRYLEHNLSVYFSPNTHLLGEAVALHALGIALPEFPRAERWKKTGADIVRREMVRQVRDDGSHFEQSSYYHVYALDLLLLHQILADAGEDFRTKLRGMADYLDALMGPTRTLPLIGDDDGGRVFHPYGRCDRFGRATLATCALLFKETKWAYEEGDIHEQALWWLGGSLGEQPRYAGGERTQYESRLFRHSGIAVLKSDSVQVLVDAGPFGAGNGGHSHSDTLSLVIRTATEDVLVDSGTYTYVADPIQRDWFRGSAAHNTIRINGKDQAMPAGPFRWLKKPVVDILEWSSTARHDLISATCRSHSFGGDVKFIHRRTVLLIRPNLLIVCDTIDGPAGSHMVEQFWHPGEVLTPVTPTCVEIGTQSHLLTEEGRCFDIEEGWRSRVFGQKSRAKMLVVRYQGGLPATLWAALSIAGEGPRAVRFLSSDSEKAVLQLTDGQSVRVHFGVPDGVSLTFPA
jgi:hypothetical protein